MFDDRNTGPTGDPLGAKRLDGDERRVYEYVSEHAPIARPSLQADLYPYDRRAFERVLSSLENKGYIYIEDVCVYPAVDFSTFVPPVSVNVAAFDGHVTLRPATKQDISELTNLIESIEYHACYKGTPDSGLLEGEGSDQSSWQSAESAVFVAEHDSQLRGWAQVSADEGSGQGMAELIGSIAEDVRRKGIGSRLHGYTVEWARAEGYDRFYQYVPAEDADTFQFLRARGWSVDGVRSGQAKTSGEYLRLVYDLPSTE